MHRSPHPSIHRAPAWMSLAAISKGTWPSTFCDWLFRKPVPALKHKAENAIHYCFLWKSSFSGLSKNTAATLALGLSLLCSSVFMESHVRLFLESLSPHWGQSRGRLLPWASTHGFRRGEAPGSSPALPHQGSNKMFGTKCLVPCLPHWAFRAPGPGSWPSMWPLPLLGTTLCCFSSKLSGYFFPVSFASSSETQNVGGPRS